ncbi:MAG: 4-hydroxythreonine-4-phosphate dehydrogenase PdxA [Candidatus Cloacimonetes bacterium]|nr:4-hydroxythreonine-4-phosphate dehydrogenase PdxA [Candidatus Cloacimonadota bacterium]
MIRIGITTGDPAGIGPEITEKALRFHYPQSDIIYVVYGRWMKSKHGTAPVKITHAEEAVKPGRIYHIEIDDDSILSGNGSTLSGFIALKILTRCTEDINSGYLSGLVTAPVSKEYIHPHAPDFMGHTEYLAERSGISDVIMSFWGPVFDLALLSTHIGIRELSGYLTIDLVLQKLHTIIKEYSKIKPKPRIALLAINPHAGENGMFGHEDFILREAVVEFKKTGVIIDGPFPADTFFAHHLLNYDLVISPYHDQGLIPFKLLSNNLGVNVTLGLPYYRTSVDHGTAYDIAGSNSASPVSMISAINWLENRLSREKTAQYSYRIFAEYYDNYMSHVNYSSWIDMILLEYNRINGKEPESILELACGTANVACQLTKRGYQVSASDNSPEMLHIAASKQYAPRLYLADMTDSIEGKYDLILCLFDSVNYLTKITLVEKMLLNVCEALTDNGIFVFDVSTYKNSIDNFTDFVNLEQDEDFFILHEADFEEKRLLQRTNLTMFKKGKLGYIRSEETHLQRIYPLAEINNAIVKSGLRISKLSSPTSERNLSEILPEVLEEQHERLFYFVARK